MSEGAQVAELARVLRALRMKRKWSQETLAKRAGVHRNTISRIEQRCDLVPLRYLMRIAGAMEIPAWRILRTSEHIAARLAPDMVQDQNSDCTDATQVRY